MPSTYSVAEAQAQLPALLRKVENDLIVNELWSDLVREVESAGPDSNVIELLEERFSDYLKDPSQAQPLDASLARFVERKRQSK